MPLATMISKGVRGEPDVSALASVSDRKLCVMVWNYHDEDVPGPAASHRSDARHLPAANDADDQFRIDDEHSNAFEAWKKMGSPKNPSSEQYEDLMKASELEAMRPAEPVTGSNVKINLPRQGVSLLVFEW